MTFKDNYLNDMRNFKQNYVLKWQTINYDKDTFVEVIFNILNLCLTDHYNAKIEEISHW